MVVMNSELQQAIHDAQGEPVQLVDPITNQRFIVLPDAVYQQLQDAAAVDAAIGYEAFARVAGPHGWDDPEMDIYEEYRNIS